MAAKEVEERKHAKFRRMHSLQLRLLTESNKCTNKEKQGNEQQVARGNTPRKQMLMSKRFVMTSSLSWTRTSSHRSEGLQKPKAISKGVDFEQLAEKRQA